MRFRNSLRAVVPLFLFLFGFLLAPGARAVEIETVPGLFYFTGDKELLQSASVERAEEGVQFAAPRDPRLVAMDHAQEELRQGNVCLRQADQDLQHATSRAQLRKICWKIFREDVVQIERRAAQQKLKLDYVRCFANVEAHEAEGSVRMVLSLRGDVVMNSRLPSSLKRAGFPAEAEKWPLPVQEASLGAVGASWKEILKNGSCTVDEPSLKAFLDRFLEQKRAGQALARCRKLQVRDAERLVRVQKQFKQYVPDEWLKEAAGREESQALLAPPAGLDSYADLAECRSLRKRTFEQLTKLEKVSGKIADRHDLPVLDPEAQPGLRAPASADPDLED